VSPAEITVAIRDHATLLVFVNVLLLQLGLPVPAVPTLMIVGSLGLTYGYGAWLLALAVLASLIADLIWYAAGRALGYRVLSSLCRISINPGSCVTSAEGLFMRWGVWSLIVGRFVPGFSILGPPIAGSLRLPLPKFAMATALGAGVWAGGAIAAGWVLRNKVQLALNFMSEHFSVAVLVSVLAVGSWLGWALWKKHRFNALAAAPHATTQELASALASDSPPLVLDLRGAVLASTTDLIPGAVRTTLEDLPAAAAHWPKDRAIVTICACPQDATAVTAAHLLSTHGYKSVKALKGGYDAWTTYIASDVAAAASSNLRPCH